MFRIQPGRIKDKTFGANFFNMIQGLTTSSSKGVDVRWKTRKQLEDIFGEDTPEMMQSLPSRPHPSCAKVQQWRLPEDYTNMQVKQTKEYKVTGATKISGDQTEALQEAMSMNMDEEFMRAFEKDFDDPSNEDMLKALVIFVAACPNNPAEGLCGELPLCQSPAEGLWVCLSLSQGCSRSTPESSQFPSSVFRFNEQGCGRQYASR